MESATVSAYEQLDHARFKYIACLTIKKTYSESGGIVSDLSITLRQSMQDESPQLLLELYNVVDLKIGDVIGGWAVSLAILDVKYWGHENINYRFTDVDSGNLQFDCEAFSFSVLGGAS